MSTELRPNQFQGAWSLHYLQEKTDPLLSLPSPHKHRSSWQVLQMGLGSPPELWGLDLVMCSIVDLDILIIFLRKADARPLKTTSPQTRHGAKVPNRICVGCGRNISLMPKDCLKGQTMTTRQST